MSTAERKDRIQTIINGLGYELEEAVEKLAATYGNKVTAAATDLEANVHDGAKCLGHEISEAERRETLMTLAANVGLLLVLDEHKRGSRTIEREMLASVRAPVTRAAR